MFCENLSSLLPLRTHYCLGVEGDGLFLSRRPYPGEQGNRPLKVVRTLQADAGGRADVQESPWPQRAASLAVTVPAAAA